MLKIRLISWILTLSFLGWIGMKGYCYFFDDSIPTVSVSGIEHNGFYSGDVNCSINGKHRYKVSTISILLDEKPLVNNYSVSKSSFEYPFTLNTKTINNGPHKITIHLKSGAFHNTEITEKMSIFIDNVPLQAAFIQNNNDVKVFQGKTLHVQFQTNKPLKEAFAHIFTRKFPCFPEAKGSLIYEAFIPVDCEEKANEYMLSIDCIDYVDNEVTLEERVQVVPFPFKKQKITVDGQKMKEEKEASQADDLTTKMVELTENSPKEKLWHGTFIKPTQYTMIFTDFGTQRTTADRGVYTHKGVDVGSMPKAAVWAPQDGIVVVKDRYTYSGNTVVIDHGWGIFSLLYHLEDFADSIQVGMHIKKGNPVGRVGKTGYANGYHLHWEMRIDNTEIDPLDWIKENF